VGGATINVGYNCMTYLISVKRLAMLKYLQVVLWEVKVRWLCGLFCCAAKHDSDQVP
jgi:hypothetical protein